MKVKKKTTKKLSSRKERLLKPAVNTPENYVFGRPSEYDRTYPEKVYEACKAGEVVSIAQICCLLDIDRDTYRDWLAKFPDFSHAIKRGLEYRKANFEKVGFQGINGGKNFNAVQWIFMSKNLFPDDYADRKEIDIGEKTQKSFGFKLDITPDALDNNPDTPENDN